MKTKIMAVCTVCAIVSALLAQNITADSDVKSHMKSLVDMGIMQGFEDGTLHPDEYVTRAQFAKMLMLAAKECNIALDGQNKKVFGDVDGSHWANEYISAMSASGIINGFEDGTFRPDEIITYEQAAKMAVQLFNISYYDNTYPVGYVSAVIGEGINDGVSALIGESLTRSDAAAIIANSIEYSKGAMNRYGSSGLTSSSGGSSSAVNGMMFAVAESAAADTASAGAGISGGGAGGASIGIIGGADGPTSIIIGRPFNTESYTSENENIFKDALTSPLSTFSIDTDTASYSNLRRFVTEGQPIPKGSVRTEELINYFDYNHPQPTDSVPFSVTTELAECPWNKDNLLAMVAVQGEEMKQPKPSNITFLIDTSGSMYSQRKLPLVKRSMNILLEKLQPTDTVSIVTYAGGVQTILDGEKAENKDKIKAAFDSLRAGGGTAGASGLNLAYEIAEKNKIDGNNRIILCTDGDFNIGPSSDADMKAMIEEKREKGIFISVLGFGMGNYKDSKMELIADSGNGNYAYIDNIREAKKVLADDMTKTLFTIAKDVKIQVEFNPEKVEKYRLIGYENRLLNNEDFDNDKKDAGELGAGATVTALYEIVPSSGEKTNDLHFSQTSTTGGDDIMYIKLRYKEPNGDESKLIEKTVSSEVKPMSENMTFASSVAQLGMILNDSEYKGTSTLDSVFDGAKASLGDDEYGLRREFLQMVDLLRYKQAYEQPIYYGE